MRVVLALATAVLAHAASPTTGLESLRHLQNKFALAQIDSTNIVPTTLPSVPTTGAGSAISDGLKKIEEWQKWNSTCLPILQEYQNNEDCKKLATYTGVPTAAALKEICENTCRTTTKNLKKRLEDAGCTPKSTTKSTDDDDEKALRGLEYMCTKQGDEYCLITMDRVSAINIDTVNWDNETEADSALSAYCSPCMEKMAPMLKKNGGDQDGIKLKLQMRYVMCNKDDKGNFCWKKVARFAKLSVRSKIQEDACSNVRCQSGYRCRISRDCDQLPCAGTCVARIDPASTILGSDPVKTLTDVGDNIESIPRPVGKAVTQQVTTFTSADLQEDVSLAATILSKREQIAEICENNCFQRSLVQLAKLYKQDGRDKAYGRINGFVNNLCQRNAEKALCLSKFVNDIPESCSPAAILKSKNCTDECKQAISDRLAAAKCCAPIITKVWAAASNLVPEEVRKAWRNTCNIQFDESECPVKNETLTRKLHLALDFAWYNSLPEDRKKAFRDSVVDDVARHVFPLNVSLDASAISAGSIVAETTISGDSASTVVATSLDSSNSGLILDSTSAQVSQDQPFTSATIVPSSAAPVPAESPSGSPVIPIVLAVVGVAIVAAVVGVVVMKKRRQSAPAGTELTETLNI